MSVFSCNLGYTLLGTPSRTCQTDLSWSNSADTICRPNLCQATLPPLLDAIISPGSSRTDLPVTYVCNSGFVLSGNAQRTCTSGGTSYNGTVPTCVAQPCLPALTNPSNGLVSGCSGSTSTTPCVFSCNTGYQLSNPSTPVRACQGTGTWTGFDYTCQPVACATQLTPPNFGTVSRVVGTFGQMAVYSCQSGYTAGGTLTRWCTSSGNWNGSSSDQTCTSQSCPALSAPTNGVMTLPGTTINSVAQFTCNTGFTLVGGPSTRMCQASLSWTGFDVRCVATPVPVTNCPPIPTAITRGFLNATHGANFGGWAVAQCNAGYSLVTHGIMVCSAIAGGWDPGSVPVCAADSCTPLAAPSNGVVSNGGVASTDSTVSLTCNAGYSLVGSASRMCLFDGTWSGAPTACLANACPALLPLANGAVSSTGGVTGSITSFSCNAGYQLSGSATATCLASGFWSNPPPVCVRTNCTAISVPANAIVSFSAGQLTDSVASFSCSQGYVLYGLASRTCLPSGVWSGLNNQVCLPAPCATYIGTSPPTNGRLKCSGQLLGAVCNASCNAGFTAFGTAQRTCLATGSWSGAADARCSAVLASACLVSLADPDNTAVAGLPLTFSVTVRNATGAIVPSTDEQIRCVVGDSQVPFATQSALYASNGMYTVQAVIATRVGRYNMSVLVNGALTRAPYYFVNVLPGAVAGAASTAAGAVLTDQLAVIGAPSTFTVQGRDAFGNAVSVGGASVTATYKVGNATLPLPPGSVVDNADGTYGVTFLPTEGGVYTLSVSINTVQILGAPWLVYVNSNCTPGFYAVEQTGPCEVCPRSTYSDSFNVPACSACPTKTETNGTGGASVKACACLVGFYSLEGGGTQCSACPVGAVCDGGTTLPRALPGFYPSTDPSIFLACNVQAKACLGDGRCKAAYRGRLCADCVPGHYKLNNICRSCKSASTKLLSTLFFVGLLAFCGALVKLNTRSSKFYGLAAFMIGFNTLQITAVYGRIDLAWPSWAQSIFSGLSFVNLNMDLTSPECTVTMKNAWLFKYIIMMLAPIFGVLPFLFWYAVARVYIWYVRKTGSDYMAKHQAWIDPKTSNWFQRRWLRLRAETLIGPVGMRNACARAFCQLILFAYMPLSATSLQYFDCRKTADGLWVQTNNVTHACYDAAYYSIIWLALIFSIIYCLGIPAVVTGVLYSRRKALSELELTLTYGFLVARFKPYFYLYDPLGIMLRKLFVVLAVTVFADPRSKALMAGFVLQISTAQVAFSLPYLHGWHNLMEVICVFSGVIVLWGGIIEFSSPARTAFVVGGLMLLLASVFAGMLYDIFIVLKKDRAEAAELEAAGTFAVDVSGLDGDGAFLATMSAVEMNDMGSTLVNPVFATNNLAPATADSGANQMLFAGMPAGMPAGNGYGGAYGGGAQQLGSASRHSSETNGLGSGGNYASGAGGNYASGIYAPPPPIPAAGQLHAAPQYGSSSSMFSSNAASFRLDNLPPPPSVPPS